MDDPKTPIGAGPGPTGQPQQQIQIKIEATKRSVTDSKIQIFS